MLRRIFRTGLFALVAVVVGGIAAGGYAAYARHGEPPPTVRIKYFGDSTIWGLNVDGSTDQYETNPPRVLEEELRARCGMRVVVENDAVPGTYASQLLYGTAEYLRVPFERRMQRSSAQIVIMSFGINDAMGYADAASYRHHMDTLARLAIRYGKTVVFESSNPAIDGSVSAIPGQASRLAELIEAQTLLAKQAGLPMVDQYYRYLKSGQDLLTLFPDGIHPTAAIAREKALRVADTIEPMVCPKVSHFGRWARLTWDGWHN
ncbi:GDSL-like Lipase/Acylhydrolase family protein [compost metagenome]